MNAIVAVTLKLFLQHWFKTSQPASSLTLEGRRTEDTQDGIWPSVASMNFAITFIWGTVLSQGTLSWRPHFQISNKIKFEFCREGCHGESVARLLQRG